MVSINPINATNKPSFGSLGSIQTKIGETVCSNKTLKKLSDKMEYNGFSMSTLTLSGILYGATIVPRYLNATDKHDKREILLRDVTSITAILFAAKALGKGISRKFENKTGYVLTNITNEFKSKKWYQKLGDMLNPDGQLSVLNSKELEQKYSNIEAYPEKIKSFVDFVHDRGGNVGKIFSNKKLKPIVEKIVGNNEKTEEEFCNKLIEADKNKTPEMQELYTALKEKDNPLVTKAKTMNSAFDFASTLLIVPAGMIGIEALNEKITKKCVAKEKAEIAAKKATEGKQETAKV